jgi:COP9 signalosome complex subunit 12
MDPIFDGFKKAYEEGNGYDLSMTLSPVDPDDDPDRLYNFFKSTNYAQIKKDFQYRILYDNAAPFKLPAEEGNGWVEVYVAYWKAVGEILNAENAPKSNAKVRDCALEIAFSLCPWDLLKVEVCPAGSRDTSNSTSSKEIIVLR